MKHSNFKDIIINIFINMISLKFQEKVTSSGIIQMCCVIVVVVKWESDTEKKLNFLFLKYIVLFNISNGEQ